jgi:hypothetical protein
MRAIHLVGRPRAGFRRSPARGLWFSQPGPIVCVSRAGARRIQERLVSPFRASGPMSVKVVDQPPGPRHFGGLPIVLALGPMKQR